MYPLDLLCKNGFKHLSNSQVPEDLTVAGSKLPTNKVLSDKASGTAFEALSLEMKQQELDSRCIYFLKNFFFWISNFFF